MKFAVSDEKNRWLAAKMTELVVSESDFEESFTRSSGNGGQHINKTSTAVHLLHRPSGISVCVSRERSQSTNRFIARRQILEQLESQLKGERHRQSETKKIRKQKARRKRRGSSRKNDDITRDLTTT